MYNSTKIKTHKTVLPPAWYKPADHIKVPYGKLEVRIHKESSPIYSLGGGYHGVATGFTDVYIKNIYGEWICVGGDCNISYAKV